MPLILLMLAALAACEPQPRAANDFPAECPEGAQWDGVRCVRSEVACPDNSSFEGGKCVALPAATAALDPLVGTWSLTGVRPDGASYAGSAVVEALAKGGPYEIEWSVGGTIYGGIASRRGDTLSVGWSTTAEYGVVDYVARGDGALEGVWYDSHSSAPGREVLTGGQPSLAGVYNVQTGVTPDGKSYGGTCDLAVTGDLHVLLWHVGNETYRGLGIRSGDVLSVGFSTAKSAAFGVVQYRISEGTLIGRWAEWSQKVPALGSETLVKK